MDQSNPGFLKSSVVLYSFPCQTAFPGCSVPIQCLQSWVKRMSMVSKFGMQIVLLRFLFTCCACYIAIEQNLCPQINSKDSLISGSFIFFPGSSGVDLRVGCNGWNENE